MATTTPDRPRLLVPGLKAPDPFLETYLSGPAARRSSPFGPATA